MPRPADPDLADRIVRATAELLEKHGIDGVTMRAVAAEAHCSATTIYQKFENKDELLDHAVVRGLEWFAAAPMTAPDGASATEQLRASARGYVEWGIRNAAMYRLIFEQRLPKPAAGEELKRRRRGWDAQREVLAGLFAARPSRARPVDLDAAADSVFVSLHGTVSLAVSGRLAGPRATTAEQLERSFRVTDALVDQWVNAWELSSS